MEARFPRFIPPHNANPQPPSAHRPPLIKNLSGDFTLTLGVEKSTDLVHFTPFPLTTPQTSIDGQGKLKFQFTVPGNAAFFRVRAQ